MPRSIDLQDGSSEAATARGFGDSAPNQMEIRS